MKLLLSALLFVLALAACDSQQAPEYQGTLYFGQGDYVMGFSLRDGSHSLVGRLGDSTIRGIEAMGREYLLITETATVNRTRVSRISRFNLKTGERLALFQGVLVRYLSTPGIVIYDDGRRLYAVPRQEGSENRIIFTHLHSPITRLVAAHSSLLLFETAQGADATIHSWDPATDQLSQLDALTMTCRLDGAVWIEPLERLACKPRTTGAADYILSDLDGVVDGPLDLPEDRRFEALTFIESENILVLRETWRSRIGDRNQHAVWTYDIRSGSSYRLADNIDLGSSVVYAGY